MATVTIAKDYFEILLRRSQINEPNLTSVNDQTVTIPKDVHQQLLHVARQFGNLRRNLCKGGVTEATLAILTNDDNQPREDEADSDHSDRIIGPKLETKPILIPRKHSIYTTTTPNDRQGNAYGNKGGHDQQSDVPKPYHNGHHQRGCDDFAFMPDDPVDGLLDDDSSDWAEQSVMQKSQYKRDARRTLQLASLAEGTTLADVVDNVRGGMLLDIYLRNDRTCTISFCNQSDAHNFFGYVKRHDLYIKDKRVEIRWSDRQFMLNKYVANKISNGATRNLIIRGANLGHTEESIREHAEHIHNLALVKVEFRGQTIFISCNSVHNAMFFKTCLMSRASYRGAKIGWDEDECAAPLEASARISKSANAQPKKAMPTTLNRFQLLNLDETEDGSEDEHETSAGTLHNHFITTTTTPATTGVTA